MHVAASRIFSPVLQKCFLVCSQKQSVCIRLGSTWGCCRSRPWHWPWQMRRPVIVLTSKSPLRRPSRKAWPNIYCHCCMISRSTDLRPPQPRNRWIECLTRSTYILHASLSAKVNNKGYMKYLDEIIDRWSRGTRALGSADRIYLSARMRRFT